MLMFRYSARNPATGQLIKANVEAADEQAAVKTVRQEGLVPISIKVAGAGNPQAIGNRLHRIKAKDRVLFSRQLSTLINAGLPIIQSLRTVTDQTTNKYFKVIITQIIGDVEGGSTLASSMAKYPHVFNQVYVNLIAAGETSGTLDKALDRLAIQQEKDADLLSKIRGALAYPAIVVLVMIAVVTFMLVKVLPQVQLLYQGLQGVSLPLITRILLGFSHFVIHFWWVIILFVIVFFLGGLRWVRYTSAGRQAADLAKIKIPPTGSLFMKMYMARFARTAGTLVGSGVPLIQVLEITGKAINNVRIEDTLKRATEKVKGGKALSDSLEGEPNFLPLVPNMLRIGEQSGSLEQMLDKTADYYEKEVDNAVKTISETLEPVLMVLLGIVAFIIVAAVLLPIYGLAGKSFVQV